jgi:hypothetical protein
MLIRFESEVGSVTMFGDHATTLLKMMGNSGTVPGALLAQDIEPAVAKLRSAVAMRPAEESQPPAKGNNKDEQQPKVTLQQRAFPLIELLERAAQRGVDVTWKQG